jgi:anhydro-N-acetylmuramic acid kinase
MRTPTPEVEVVARELTDLHVEAVDRLLSEAGVRRKEVTVVGFHGHTIVHDPANGLTIQIGDGARLAERTGIDVMFDFRSNDVTQGGQGAPLVPVYHRALAAGLPHPLVVLNVGGVANVTWIGVGEGDAAPILAFDTGPGVALLDDLVHNRAGLPYDAEGALALAGKPDAAILQSFLADPFFKRRPPKSLDRGAFSADPVMGLALADAAATLAAFTAGAAALAEGLFPAPVTGWVVAGGGRRNPAILKFLVERLSVPVRTAEEVGWDGDALEAQAFAYLAVRALKGLPVTFPETTGAPRPLVGGRLARAPVA